MIRTVNPHRISSFEFEWILVDHDERLKDFYRKRCEIYFTHWGNFIIEDEHNKVEISHETLEWVQIEKITREDNPEYYL